MKKVILTIGMALFFAAAAVAVGPFFTISQIKTGIVENNPEKLADHIAFPSLRENIKEQLNSAMIKTTGAKASSNPFTILAAGFASKMLDGVVDFFVTPTGLTAFMKGKKPVQGKKTTDSLQKEDLFKNAKYRFDSIDKFSIWVPNEQGKVVRFILERQGFSWKLVNLIIPATAN